MLSIPETPGGQVLAMVEQPGEASELLSVPQPEAPAATAACRTQGRRGRHVAR